MEQWLYRGSSREKFSVVSRLPEAQVLNLDFDNFFKQTNFQFLIQLQICNKYDTKPKKDLPPSARDMSSVVDVESTPPTRSKLLLTTALVWYLICGESQILNWNRVVLKNTFIQSKHRCSLIFLLTSYFSKVRHHVAIQVWDKSLLYKIKSYCHSNDLHRRQ